VRSRRVDFFGVAIDKDGRGNAKTSFAKQYLVVFASALLLALLIGSALFWLEAGPQAWEFLHTQVVSAIQQFEAALKRN
jgi:hypothetical protein